mmetsp:Transcript_24781/g.38608  ORF Transcript_24781/g.38608 Transcript_24781/m.38608 type:complete len:81 (-) Transcript_24781:123-365(-)
MASVCAKPANPMRELIAKQQKEEEQMRGYFGQMMGYIPQPHYDMTRQQLSTEEAMMKQRHENERQQLQQQLPLHQRGIEF